MPDPRSSSDPPGRAGWRSQPKTSGSGRAARSGGWAKKVDDGIERTVMRYRTKVLFWLSLFVVLVVGFVAWLIWTPMRTPFLVAAAYNYDFPLPPNAWAKEDAERLAALDKQEVLKYKEVVFESKDAGLKQLRRQLEAAKPGGPAKNVIVIYLSLHGAVNAAGEPCLIPPGIPPLESGKWLRVADLLDALFPTDKPALRSSKVKKLLILDSNRMEVNWNLGLLYNDFAEKLPAVVSEKNIPELAVLNSTSPGQIGYSAVELQGSVFGYFLSQGLHGAADTEQSGNLDRDVSLQEFFSYLKSHVSQWVIENRADRQTPMLMLPPDMDADFPLVFARTHVESSAPGTTKLRDPRWEEVHKLWKMHAALKEKQIWRSHPQEWEELQQGLLRLEQLLQAGSAYREQFDEAKKDLQSLAGSLDKNDTSRNFVAFSLPLMRSYGNSLSNEELTNLPVPWKTIVKTEIKEKVEVKENAAAKDAGKQPPSKPEDKNSKSVVKEEKDKKPSPEPAPPPPARYSYLAAATAAWDWVLNNPFSREKLAETLAFVDRAENRPETDVVEMQFLRMLVNYLDPMVWQSSSQSIKQAILARNLAETASAPADDRSFYWVFSQIDRGDAIRRFAEDWLFVGSPNALSGAEKAWNDVLGEKGIYPQAIATEEKITAAYRLRDRAYSELPYLARWILSRPESHPASDVQLRAAIGNLHKLSRSLDVWESDNSAAQVFAAGSKLKEDLENLETAYFKECAELRTAGEDKQTLAALLSVLAVPLVTGEQRHALWDEFQSIAKKVESSGAGYRVAAEEKTASTAIAATTTAEKTAEIYPYLERLKSWNVHPLLLMLEERPNDEDQNTKASLAAEHKERSSGEMIMQLADQGEQIRRLLLGEREQTEKQLAETIRLIKIVAAPLPSPSDIRKPLSMADRAIRSAAPLVGRHFWDDSKNNPLHRLQDLDRHNLLLWQARRTLEDFWGPKNAGERPYFEMAAQSYLKSAVDLFKEDIALREGSVPRLLEARRQAAAQGLQLEKPRDLLIDEKDSSVKQSLAVSAPTGFPSGAAAVYLQGIGGSLFPVSSNPNLKEPDLRRMADELDPGTPPKKIDVWIPNNDRLRATPQFQAVAYYRGYLRAREFYVQSASGVDIAYQKPAYPKPTITVRGDTRQTSNLMFIFDCSGSMGAKVDISPNREGPSQSATRLQVARSTLEAILQRLIVPHQNPYHIGLIIYGHRVGWNPKNQDQIVMRNPKNPAEFIPPPPGFDILPSNDVELVLPLGPFTKEEFNIVHERLTPLLQLGETPLYLAIIHALDDLEAAEAGSARHIVVLTDGKNEQSNVGDPRFKTRLDVEKAFALPAHKGVKLDILGFDLPAEEARELIELAPLTGGAYFPVTNPASLIKALEKTLGLIKYQVLRIRDGKLVTPDPLDLNTTCEDLDRPGDRPIGYRVQLADRERPAKVDVAMEGGEALEMFVKEDANTGGRRLVFRRYDKALRDSANNVRAPGDPQKRAFFLGAHLPEWTGGGAKFFLSVQNADAEQFSPRPAEVWVEIKPVMPEGFAELPPYIFYDRFFEPDRPVPMMEFFAPFWPPEAKEAEIRFWCKLEKTPPDKQVPVADLRGTTFSLEGVPDVTFEVETKRGATASDPYQIIVTERHPPGGDLALVKVEMAAAPESIKRRYNYKTGVIVHTFFYDDLAASDAERYQILFTTKQKLTDAAITPPRPLKVTVPRE